MSRMEVSTASAPEAVLERDYARLRRPVLAAVRARLRASRISLPDQDLEAFYNQAWHALYERMVAGEEIESRTGFLVQVAYRRAVDDLRRLRPDERADLDAAALSDDDDVVERLDDRRRVREFVEALRDELDERERVAASLCYVHGYTRAEAAEAMGLSTGRMKKVMDEVSRTVARFTAQIQAGERCEASASRTKAYALGLLDPDGERYRAARLHLDECPSCRADVLRLRGLAAIAPPALLPWATAAVAAGGGAAGIAAGGGGSEGGGASATPRPQRASRVTAAAAAVAVVVVAVVIAAIALSDRDDPAPAAAATAPAPAAPAPRPSTSASASEPPAASAEGRRADVRAPAGSDDASAGSGRERRAASASPPTTSARTSRPAASAGTSRPAASAGTPAPTVPEVPASAQAPPPAPEPAPAVSTPVADPAPASPDEQAAPAVDESGTQEFGLEP